MARPPRTMIDSRTQLVQSIITTIGALRPPTENESPTPYTRSRFRGSHKPRCFSFLTPTSRQVRPATRDWPCVVSFASSEAPVRSSDLPQCPCTDGFLTSLNRLRAIPALRRFNLFPGDCLSPCS
eukprot:g15420.t1